MTALLTSLGGSPAGEEPGRAWEHGRFRAPYLRDSMLDLGVLVETLETATFWSRVEDLYAAVKAALQEHLGRARRWCCATSPTSTRPAARSTSPSPRDWATSPWSTWLRAKRAASDAIVAHGATISHHHAVGTDHLPWLEAEIGPVGVRILRAVKAELDPTGVLNPGVLIP